MDSSAYKSLKTSRGLTYSYYVSKVDESKPTILFLHGFPSTSREWKHQVAYFRERGFSVIVPDLLGYGGTDKPKEVEFYKFSAMAKDVIEILDAENVEKAIAIAHDWGGGLLSRIANFYPERFLGYAFLASGYIPPTTMTNYKEQLAQTKEVFGYELFGYWTFFSEEGADKVIEDHWDSFVNILYPADGILWKTDMAPTGTLKAWVVADKKAPDAPYLTPEHREYLKKTILAGGLAGPLNWYKVMTSGIASADNKQIPQERHVLDKPTFFAAAKQDYICLPVLGQQTMPQFCPNLTIREFDACHWVQLQKPDEINPELEAWIAGFT